MNTRTLTTAAAPAPHAPSYYAATANPAPARPPLMGEASADICIVGAGFTGISAALHLAEAGFSVIVLETNRVGWGASGRNGGQIVNGYSRDIGVLIARYGETVARALGAMSLEGGAIIRERVAKYAIACDLAPGGLRAALTPKQMREVEALKRTWEQYGHNGLELIDKAGMRGLVASDLYVGGLLDRHGGHMHPLNLVLGEAAAFESLGGRIHEGSRVTRIETGAKPVVHTAQGHVAARTVIVCGNAYLGDALPELSSKIMPVSTHVLTTAPLDPKLVAGLLPTNVCVEDCNYVLDYFRRTPDHRLIYGGGIGYGGQTPASIEASIRPHLARTFPKLRDAKVEFAWSGNFALTLTRVPHVGRLSPPVYLSHGDSGHGVTTTHLLGRLLAEAIRGQAERFDVFARLPFHAFPGGQALRVPLTALGAWYYGLRDRLGV